MQECEKTLAAWDGRSTQVLVQLYQAMAAREDFLPALIQALQNEEMQRAASWLLKHSLEQGHRLSPAQIEQVYNAAPLLVDWESKLHLLQSMPYMPISQKQKQMLMEFVEDNLGAQNKFLRAWSYQGYYEIVGRDKAPDEIDAAFIQLLQNALEREAPSVKARIRAILKQASRA